MIFDKENVFFNHKTLSADTLTSDVIYVGPGESACPLTLVALVENGSSGGTLSCELQTASDEAFSSPKTLGTYTGESVAVPRGNLGYLRLVATSTYTSGTLLAGLVLEDNIDW